MSGQDSAAPVARPSLLAKLRGMRRSTKTMFAGAAAVAAVVAVVVVLTGSAAGKPAAPPPMAKGFTLPELGEPGQTVSLSAYQGKPLIINFFASWCAPCQRETPLIATFYADAQGRVIVIGIDSNDEKSPALRFVQKAGVRYPVGFDPYPSTMTTSYGVLALPQTFFLNAEHRIVRHLYGAVTLKQLTAGVALMDKRQADRG